MTDLSQALAVCNLLEANVTAKRKSNIIKVCFPDYKFQEVLDFIESEEKDKSTCLREAFYDYMKRKKEKKSLTDLLRQQIQELTS